MPGSSGTTGNTTKDKDISKPDRDNDSWFSESRQYNV